MKLSHDQYEVCYGWQTSAVSDGLLSPCSVLTLVVSLLSLLVVATWVSESRLSNICHVLSATEQIQSACQSDAVHIEVLQCKKLLLYMELISFTYHQYACN